MKKPGFFKWMFSDWKAWVIIILAVLIGIPAIIHGITIILILMFAVLILLFAGDYVYWKNKM